jgi:hypothetical protein
MLAAALEAEVDAYVVGLVDEVDDSGKPKAAAKIVDDTEVLLSFFDYPGSLDGPGRCRWHTWLASPCRSRTVLRL